MKTKIDLSGKRFGRLVVIEFSHKEGKRQYWKCKCDCGTEKLILGMCLRKIVEGTRSCGCLARELSRKRATTHGLTKTPEFNVWTHIIDRCTNPNSKAFFNYGMRGITVCERWLNSFANFLEDMGYRPSPKYSIDRYPDNDGNYEPSNCRWGTQRQQSGNRRTNRWIEYEGRKMIVADWAREFGINRHTILEYIKKGHSEQEAIEYYINKNLAKCK